MNMLTRPQAWRRLQAKLGASHRVRLGGDQGLALLLLRLDSRWWLLSLWARQYLWQWLY